MLARTPSGLEYSEKSPASAAATSCSRSAKRALAHEDCPDREHAVRVEVIIRDKLHALLSEARAHLEPTRFSAISVEVSALTDVGSFVPLPV